jgi:hypothetical protein
MLMQKILREIKKTKVVCGTSGRPFVVMDGLFRSATLMQKILHEIKNKKFCAELPADFSCDGWRGEHAACIVLNIIIRSLQPSILPKKVSFLLKNQSN